MGNGIAIKETEAPGQRKEASTRESALTMALLVGGVLGWVQFNATVLIEGATRPAYDAVRNAVSALSLTSAGFVNVISLLTCGLLTIGMAIGVRRAYSVRRRIFWGPLFIFCIGAGVTCAGLFLTDPGQGYPPGVPTTTTVHGTLHFALGVPGTFGGLLAAGLTFARYFWDERRRALSVYSALTGVVGIGGVVGFAAWAFNGGPAGISERISFGAAMIWLAVVAVHSYRQFTYRRGGQELVGSQHQLRHEAER